MNVLKLFAALIGGLAFALPPAMATFPERPVKIIVPYPAGGGSDAVARLMAKKLSDIWGQPVVIDNRPGADTQIGNLAVAKAAPDGYTLLLIASTFNVHKHFATNLPYDPDKDFTPIASFAVYPYFLAVGQDVPAKTVAELIALAKRQPGKLNHAISSGGQYILAELMKRSAGIDVQGIRYKGGAPALQALITGEVTYHLDQPGTFKPMLDAGRLRVLAVTGNERSPMAPQAPTFAEVGLAGGEIVSWIGLAAPKGVTNAMIEATNAAVRAALDAPDVKQQLSALLASPMPMNVRDFTQFVRSDAERSEKTIKQFGLKE